jgi:hypothetical protein
LLLTRSRNNARGVNYDVHINAPRILPAQKNDERVVMSRCSVFNSVGGDSYWDTGGITMVMRKETRTKWLFFQEPQWRIVAVPNLPMLPGQDE